MSRPVLQPSARHPITIEPTKGRVVVRVGDQVVADSRHALTLQESTYPAVQYIPMADVDQGVLRRTDTSTYCPFKGDASYYSVRPRPAAWSKTSSGPTRSRTPRSPRSPTTWPSTRTAPR